MLARYPLPNYAAGALWQRTYATASKVATNANQFSIRIDHKISAKDQFLARFNMDNLTGPTTNPDQTAIDPAFGVQYIDRQRNVVGTWTRTASPRLIFESSISITRIDSGLPYDRPHRSRGEVQRRAVRGIQFCRRLGDAGVRQPVSWPRERRVIRGAITHSRPALKRA